MRNNLLNIIRIKAVSILTAFSRFLVVHNGITTDLQHLNVSRETLFTCCSVFLCQTYVINIGGAIALFEKQYFHFIAVFISSLFLLNINSL